MKFLFNATTPTKCLLADQICKAQLQLPFLTKLTASNHHRKYYWDPVISRYRPVIWTSKKEI